MDLKQQLKHELLQSSDVTGQQAEQAVSIVLNNIANILKDADNTKSENYNSVGLAAYLMYKSILKDN